MSIGEQRRREGKREEQWRYQINREQERVIGDLLAQIPPTREHLLETRSVGETAPEGAQLWGRLSADGSTVEFLRGEAVCGRTQAQVLSNLTAPLEATLFVVIADANGVLSLRPLQVDRRTLRPPTENDVH